MSGATRTNDGGRAPPLAGLKVVDFTIVMSGPMCTRTLADAGADVVKIEPPDGDVVRQREPVRGGISTYFASMNCGKRSIVLDLHTEDGRQLARELTKEADIVVENFRPGVMQRLGLDYAALAERNPRLVYASISGFGQRGPKAGAPAYAPVIHAASGFEAAYSAYQRGSDRPANNGIFMADVMGASYAFGAVLLALFERERSGRGQHIDVSLMDSVLGMLVYEMQAAQFPPDRPRQVYEPVRSSDGYVMVAAVTQRNLEALFEAIGFPEGKTDARFATVADKEANWAALLDLIERWTCTRTGADCERILMQAGVPCSRYRSVAEAMADPQCEARELFVEMGEADARYKVANVPYRLSATAIAARPSVPHLGEHTEEVLQETLGLDVERLAELRRRGAFGASPRS